MQERVRIPGLYNIIATVIIVTVTGWEYGTVRVGTTRRWMVRVCFASLAG